MDATPPSPPPLPSISEQSLPAGENKRPPKSPPLAFEPTPNDALAPRIPQNQNNLTSPPQHSADMGLTSPPLQSSDARELQRIINQQAMALKLAHQAFAAERQAWDLERDKLFSRIMSFEQLLRVGGGYSYASTHKVAQSLANAPYSPAKSPTLSPSLTSPQSKASNSHRLPSIAEDDNIQPLSARREGAPQSIELPRFSEAYRRRSVEFAEDEASPTSVKVEEINIAPRPSMAGLSPLPLNHQMEAGHTPGKRPATPPPDKALYSSTDGIEDTPTRNNTHINSYLVRSNDEESDRELKGPLNMPELPHAPGEENFTFDMLSRRLEQIEQHPEDINARPMVFAEPSPGLASPADPEDNLSPKTVDP